MEQTLHLLSLTELDLLRNYVDSKLKDSLQFFERSELYKRDNKPEVYNEMLLHNEQDYVRYSKSYHKIDLVINKRMEELTDELIAY